MLSNHHERCIIFDNFIIQACGTVNATQKNWDIRQR